MLILCWAYYSTLPALLYSMLHSTVMDLQTKILACLFSPLMYARLHNQSPLLTMLCSTLLYSTPLHSAPLRAAPHHSAPLCATLLYTTLLHATLLYATLCYATLLYAMLLYSTLKFDHFLGHIW